ncbi:MurR/RpiR family transcriptional regulator [Serinibacter salmoneus]|uniref:RpiR family transcriptional regulator n=1 Tax=Serinibacter salmoneus TaxID=556530 RepID=A0A2A9D2H6_9MICO|nr:MurR/RpiR family transcriptional regulator [Serinibacter salmoneus]PFG20060.1 RpiR family transcriptional regulator [Serinibacter salmoneus]
MQQDALELVRLSRDRLSAQEGKVAAVVLERPEALLDATAGDLAILCEVSPATVARFCQSVGFSGYREFRIAMAATVSRGQAELERFELDTDEIDPADGIEDVIAKVRFHEVSAIEQTLRSLDRDSLERAVASVVAARRIEIVGFGASGLTAQDLHQKLRRIGHSCAYSPDVHLALPSAAVLAPGDCVLAVSHSGRTGEVLSVLDVALEAGATAIAVTNDPDSPLAHRADIVLTTRATERRFRSGAMASRSAQHAVLDVLFIRTAQETFGESSELLRRTYEAVARRQ